MTSSRSRQQTTTETTTQNVSRNLNIQDVEGVTVGEAGGDVSIQMTDFNAIDRATSLAERSVDAGERIALEQSDFLRDISSDVGSIVRDAFGFGRSTQQEALDAIGTSQSRAFGFASDSQAEAFSFASASQAEARSTSQRALDFAEDVTVGAGDFIREALGFSRGVVEAQQASLSQTAAVLQTSAREASKSTDERVAEISAQGQRTVLIAVGIIAAGLVAFAAFRR